MWLVSNRFVWIFMYAALLYVIAIKHKLSRKLIVVLALFGVAVGLSDFVCGSIIRNLVARPRPSRADSGIASLVHVVNNYHGGHYGFPSCHAANSFALATVTTLYFRKRTLSITMFVWAILLCYSRMYLGVHYPGDILAGAVAGTAIAFGAYYAVNHYVRLRERVQFKHVNVITCTTACVFLVLIVISMFKCR